MNWRLPAADISQHAARVSPPENINRANEETPAALLRRAIPLTLVLACGVAFSALVALVVRNQERERFEADFDRQAQIQWRSMQVAIREYEECLYMLRGLFDSSNEVSSGEFRRMAGDLRMRHSGIELLAWLPRVRREERVAFEAGAVRADGAHFFIHDGENFRSQLPPIPSPDRDEYLPIQFCEPVVGNVKLFGFDQLRGPYLPTATRAIESGEVSATKRVTLGEDYGEEPGWACALPVYFGDTIPQSIEGRRERFRGIVVGAVRFSNLIANTVQKLPTGDIDVVLLDESATSGERFLVGFVDGQLRTRGPDSGDEFRRGIHRLLPMPVAGRNWVAFFRPNTQPVLIYPWVFLAGGIAYTTMLMALLHAAQQRTLMVQKLVNEKTAELHATQRTLYDDHQRRRKAEERYRAFVEQSNEAIWRFELSEPIPVDLPEDEQIILYYERAFLAEANDSFAQMYGFERAKEMIGMSLADLMPRDRATFEHLRHYVRSGYRLSNAESHEVGRNGVKCIFLNNLTGIVENGRLVRAWGTQRDVTEQRVAEDARQRAEIRLRSALAAANLGTWEWEVESDIITWSETTERMFGFAPGTFRGGLADYLKLAHPDHRAGSEARLRKVAREGGSLVGELCIIRQDGAERWIATRGDVIRDEQGSIVRVVGAVMDVTEQHAVAEEKAQIERRLQETQKLESLGILAGGVAHDFNNLLTGILGNTNLAQMDLPEASPVQENLAAIEKTSRRAAELCKQMLAYSGKGRFVVQRLDLSEIVEETAQLVRPSLSRFAALEFHLAKELPAISADATQLRQIVMNLVLNASDSFDERPGKIVLETGVIQADSAYLASTILSPDVPAGEYVFLEIRDTGCGMSSETLSKIFNPFFSTKFTGRGLGLAAVLGILRGHCGAIKVSSEVGVGSTFRLLLPSAGEPVKVLPPAPPAVNQRRGSGTILVADDEPAIRIVASRLLESFGYRVVLAENGSEALEIFQKSPADYTGILLDLTMPKMDGMEAFTAIRLIREDVPVVLMSGFNEQDAISRFSGKNLAGFVQKPFTPDELRQAIRKFIEV